MSLMGLFIALAIVATLYSLGCGVTTMALHRDVGHHSGEGWMIRRLGFQAAALALLLAAALMGR